MASSGNTAQISPIKKGAHYGRKINYSAVNSAIGEVTQRSSIVLFVRAKVVSVECITMKNSPKSTTEMINFLNSLKVK